jgi:hypothetical protein
MLAGRTLEAYWEYAGIDIVGRTVSSADKFCVKHTKRRAPEAAEAAGAAAAAEKPRSRPARLLLGSTLQAQPGHWATLLVRRLRGWLGAG